VAGPQALDAPPPPPGDSDPRFSEVAESLPGLVFQTSRDGTRLLYVNAGYEEIFGRSAAELGSDPRALLEHVHPEDRPRVEAAFRQELRHGRFNEEFRIRRPDGSARWVLMRTKVLRDGSGAPASVVGAAQDITGRRRAEEALRLSEARNRALVDAIPDLIFVLSAEGTILDYHAQDHSRLLLPPGAFLGQAYSEVLPVEVDEAARPALARALETGAPQVFEYSVTLQGELRDHEARVVACGPDRLLVISRDVTERRRAEDVARRAQRLDSEQALSGRLGHRFNNLLAVIASQASLAQSRLAPDHPSRANLAKALAAVESATELTRKMLDYSGQGAFVPEVVDLSRALGESRALLAAALPRGLRVEWELAEALPAVQVDPRQVQQVLTSLALSAAEAMGEFPGVLRISTSSRDLGSEVARFARYTARPLRPGVHVLLEVADNGAAIEEAALPRVFEPFFAARLHGLGLGLAAVLGVMRRHGGGIAVESGPGGTSFTLAFPAAGEAEPLPASAAARGRAVLVVDDQAPVREPVLEILALAGLRAFEAHDGQQALEVVRRHGPELGAVLLDYSMPGLSAEETFHELRRLAPDLPIVLSSGYSQEEATRRFAGRGLAGFLAKPYPPRELLRVVGRALDLDLDAL
jgi:PAS domain S-box-containing protein